MSRALALALAFAVALGVACRPTSSLPDLGPAPEFALVDQRGAAFSSADLAGKIVVGNFIFTTCTDICPLLTGTMSQIQARLAQAGLLGNKAMLISVSVDPQRDTPQALAEYADRFGADYASWRFLTGDAAQIESLLVTGYKVGAPFRGPPGPDGQQQLAHSNRFVIVDPKGQIRAYPRGDELDVDQIVEEVRRLAG